MNENPAIALTRLRKVYGDAVALADVTLEVGRGELFAYVGPNGAGKTTTIKILTGLIPPTAGVALVCGRNILDDPLAAKACFGYLPESGALFEKLSAREYLAFVGQLYGLEESEIRRRSARWLGFFDLLRRADERLGAFSRGTRQKVCWAAALLHDPEVLVLDEPLTGLDVESVARVKDLLRELAAAGRTVFYSSHMIDVVEKVCTRIGVLHGGRLIACGTLAEVRGGASSLEQALVTRWQEAGTTMPKASP